MNPLEIIARKSDHAWRLSCALAANSMEAEDILQEAWLVATRREADIPEGKEWPWFTGVLANTARASRRRRPMSQLPDEIPANLPEGVDEETLHDLRTALSELEPDLREAVSVTHLVGLNVRDAAEALSIPSSTLHDRVERGLERLRSRLKKHRNVVALLAVLPFPRTPDSYEVMKLPAKGTAGRTGTIAAVALAVCAVLLLVWMFADGNQGTDNSPAIVASTPITKPDDTAPDADNEPPNNSPLEASPENADSESLPEPEPEPEPPAETDSDETAATVTIIGRFVSTGGDPISGAHVWIVSTWWDDDPTIAFGRRDDEPPPPRKFKVTTTTDNNGRFSLADVPDGAEARVFAAHPEYHCKRLSESTRSSTERGFGISMSELTAGAGVTMMSEEGDGGGFAAVTAAEGLKVELTASPAAWLTGRVLDPDGGTIEGAHLRVESGVRWDHLLLAGTDRNGFYRLATFGDEEEYTALITAPNFRPREITIKPRFGGAELDVVLRRAAVVYGKFTPDDPDELFGLTVHVSCPGERHKDNIHHETGEYRVDTLEVGRSYRVRVVDEGFWGSRDVVHAESDWFIASETPIEINLSVTAKAKCEVVIPAEAFGDDDAVVIGGVWERDRHPSMFTSMLKGHKLGTAKRDTPTFTAEWTRDGTVTIFVIPKSLHSSLLEIASRYEELWVAVRCEVFKGQVVNARPVRYQRAWIRGTVTKDTEIYPVYDKPLAISDDQRVSTTLPAGEHEDYGLFWPGKYTINGKEIYLKPGENYLE